jgi:hypothetical protein
MHESMETRYLSTELDLKSRHAFDVLHRELSGACVCYHYVQRDDGDWIARFVVFSDEDAENAEASILELLGEINQLSRAARAEFDKCYLREFDIGIECWDTWGYMHAVSVEVVRAVAEVGCSIGVTLYAMRNPDGTPKGF